MDLTKTEKRFFSFIFFCIAELRTAFSMLDANHDGRVSLEELEDMLCRMGFNIPHETLDLLLQDKATSPEGQVFGPNKREAIL